MALFFFTNGVVREPINSNKNSHLNDKPAIRHLDLSNNAKQREPQQEYPRARYNPTLLTAKKATVASPSQKNSYVGASATDSLDNRRRLKATHVMSSPVVTAMPHDLVQHAKQLMLVHDISHIIVINDKNNPLGLITAKEFLEVDAPQTSFIQSVLNPNTFAVSKDTLVRDIALTFMKYKATAICVVDDQHQLVGIISRSDLMSLLVSSPNQQTKA
jgi:CBS domain-containing protein